MISCSGDLKIPLNLTIKLNCVAEFWQPILSFMVSFMVACMVLVIATLELQ